MAELLAVGAGGFIGAVARYGLSRALALLASELPWLATTGVNTLGCFALGALMGSLERWTSVSAHARHFLIVGLLGSFTTFSTFSWESLEFFRSGNVRAGLGHIVVSVALGLAAAVAGFLLVRR